MMEAYNGPFNELRVQDNKVVIDKRVDKISLLIVSQVGDLVWEHQGSDVVLSPIVSIEQVLETGTINFWTFAGALEPEGNFAGDVLRII